MLILRLARFAIVLLCLGGAVEFLQRRDRTPTTVIESTPPSEEAHVSSDTQSARVAIPIPAHVIARPVAPVAEPEPKPEAIEPKTAQAPTIVATTILADQTIPRVERPDMWLAGKESFERERQVSEGLGAPGFNAKSCATCHKDPVSGGAGNLDFNVIQEGEAIGYRPSKASGDNLVRMREVRTELQAAVASFRQQVDAGRPPQHNLTHHELERAIDRCEELAFGVQTPTLLGLGRIDQITDEEILSREDPDDLDGDGIRGVARRVEVNGKEEVGRFGWKANVPHLADFVCMALGGENGLTAPDQGRGFGLLKDRDQAPDPEVPQEEFDQLVHFVASLPPPERTDQTLSTGEILFEHIGCTDCHVPSLASADGEAVHLYSDLLVHELAETFSTPLPSLLGRLSEPEEPGFRTAPLWGVGATAPYMHSGRAETLHDAILAHGAEGRRAREAYEQLRELDRLDLIAFLEQL